MRTRIHRARWGLLVTTIIMGGALAASQVVNYYWAQKSSAAIAQSGAAAMIFSVKRELWHSPGDVPGALKSAAEDLAPHGLRFAGIADLDGVFEISVGEPSEALGALPRMMFPDAVAIERLAAKSRIRAIAPVRTGPPSIATWRDWLAGKGFETRYYLILEIEPLAAEAVISRAVATMAVGMAGAVILIAAAMIFWHLSRRTERMEAQLAHDQQLKTLGQMSAVLGHELRNPLASLKGHAQLLLEKTLPEQPIRRGVETIVNEARRLEELSRQILDFAKTGECQLEPAEPAAVAQAAIERSQAAPVELRLEGEPQRWAVDAAKMEQVLVNLLHNARQVSLDSAPIELLMRTEPGRLVIEVRDHGPGIPPDDLDKIFEPFFTSRTKGTGLGLTLAKRIVESHGGQISAANHPQGGAVLRLVLPRAQEV